MAILFKEDWDNYPNAIVDMKTSNKSFIDLAVLYREMGVENHAFLLALHNPALVGVDPHSDNLTMVEIQMIIIEATENPWYFFRECVLAPPLAGIDGVPFKANRGNIATLWNFFNHMMTLLIQPRQTGKSFTVDALMTGLMNIWSSNTKINLLTKDEKLRTETVGRIKEIFKYIPKYLNLRTKSDPDNGEGIKVGLMNNEYKTHVAQSSAKAAFNAARGLSSPIMHIDEFAYYKHIDTALPAALPATGAAMDNARNAGAPHGVLLTTTAGWLDSAPGKYAFEFYSEAAIWDERFYDSQNLEAYNKMVRTNSSAGMETLVIDMTHRQLGFTDLWLKRRIQAARSTEGKAETDFLNIWAEGSSASPFDKQMMKEMKATIREDAYKQITERGYIIRWQNGVRPENLTTEKMVMGLDTSDAVGKDDIAMVIRRVSNGEVIGVGQFNETNTITFGLWISELLVEFTGMTLIIERRSTGTAIIDHLLNLLTAKGINPFTRIFSWCIQERNKNEGRFDQVMNDGLNERTQDMFRQQIGFATSASGRASRDKLYGAGLQQSMEYTYTKIYDKILVSQILGLTTRNGRIDHSQGNKDDLVIAWLLGYWFLSNAKHVEQYGLEQNELLANVNLNVAKDDTEAEDIKLSNLYKAKLHTLMEKLEKTEEPAMINMLLTSIERLKPKIKGGDGHLNIENAVSDIMTVKKKVGAVDDTPQYLHNFGIV